MKKILLALAVMCAASHAFAQTAFTGTYTWGANGNTNSFGYNGTDIANLTESAFTKVGVTTGSSSGNFRASGWALDLVTNSLTGTNDPTKYFEFSLTADSGFTLSMTNINFGIGRSGTGARTFAWASSVDSFGSIITNYSSLGSSGQFTNNNGAVSFITDSTSTTATNVVLDLSGASFQNLTSITFRFYGWNAEQTGGTAGLQGPLSFSGSLLNTNPITGGAYWAADPAGGGSGTWTAAGTTWATNTGGAGAGQTQSSANLVFADTAGTVTVSGGVSASNGMTFQTTGYAVQGSGTITLVGAALANNAITTDAGVTTTISSELAGTAGMTKSGSGTLVLSGENTFSGNIAINAGTLEITNDSALGNAANDLANNGTLKTTTSVSLGAGRDLSGSGTYDIADGTTLTVNGNAGNSGTTLANSGTLDLQGATRSLGAITLDAPATIDASGAISATGLTAPGVTSGTATINPDIVFTSGDKTLNVASGGTVDLNGALSNGGLTGRIAKTGAGTLILSAANNMGGLRVGTAGSTPVDGGTVILENSVVGTQAQAIQHNFGVLSAASNLTITNGLSIGGRTAAVAVLSGGDMEFQGQSGFFRGTGTSGELRLDVNNTTTFSGGFAATSGSGSATGVTFGGSGEIVISGTSSALIDNITLADSITLTLNSEIGGGVAVGSLATLGGTGSMGGSLSFASGAKLVFDLNAVDANALTVNGGSVSFAGFGIDDLVGLDSSVANGAYTILDGSAIIETANLGNLGLANAFDLGGGKSAYFSEGSLVVNVVPEPSTYAMLALAGAGFAGYVIRRRRR